MPGILAQQSNKARAVLYAALGVCAVCGVASSIWWQGRSQRLGLLSLQQGGEAGREDQLYGQIVTMNNKLRSENERLHKLLQADENADIHVETQLQHDDASKSARLRKEMQREERMREELDSVLGKGRERREKDVVDSGEEARMGRRLQEQAEVQSLLDSAKAQADRRLGISDDADAQSVFAADVQDALGPSDGTEALTGSQRPGGGKNPSANSALMKC